MKNFIKIFVSWGFYLFIAIAFILGMYFILNGNISSFKEFLWLLVTSILVALMYVVFRIIPGMDEPIWFAKGWFKNARSDLSDEA